MNKYTKPTLHKLETLFKELEYTVRYEKGTFNSGYCVVESSKMVVVNKFYDTEGRVGILIEILLGILNEETELSDKSRQFLKHLLKTHDTLHKTIN